MSIFKMLKFMFASAPRAKPGEQLARVRSGEALLVDVREPGEWPGGVARSAALLPLSDLTGGRTQWKTFLADVAGREILLYCASGARSRMAANVLAAEGFRATNAGALADWAQAGWTIEKSARSRA